MAVSRRRLLYLLLLSLSFAVGTLFGACLVIFSSHSSKIASGRVRASIRARDMFHVDLHKTRSLSSEELSCGEEPLRLVVLVFSAPSWTLRRDAIRMSWIGMYPTNRDYQVRITRAHTHAYMHSHTHSRIHARSHAYIHARTHARTHTYKTATRPTRLACSPIR